MTSWRSYPAAILGYTERDLLEWLGRTVRPGETWLDIGSHYGYTAIALSRLVGPYGRVFAFEPVVATAGYLCQTRSLNQLEQLSVLPVGLAAPQDLEFQRKPLERGMADSTVSSPARMETIAAARLDWLWPRVCGADATIDGVKMDVQGMEVEALHGMVELLSRQRPRLVVELHRGVERSAVVEILRLAGYAPEGKPIDGGVADDHLHLDDRSYAFEAV